MSWFTDLFRKKPTAAESDQSKIQVRQDTEDAIFATLPPRSDIEQWKTIPGTWGNYEVSNLGHLRSGFDGVRQACNPANTGRSAQAHCWIRQSSDYRRFTMSRLVAELFIRPLNAGDVVSYVDGNHMNNAATNLKIRTRRDVGIENTPRGESCTSSKLTAAEVSSILMLRKRGWLLAELGKAFHVSESTVSLICSGKRWGAIKEAA